MSSQLLSGRVCLVTGASRGIGRGIAVILASKFGAKVYITGRTLKPSDGSLGSLQQTASEISQAGGECIPVQCDHSKDEDVRALFDRIDKENSGRLDILVNNAYAGVSAISDNMGKRFWEVEPSIWDDVNNVGLRNHYFCTTFAARLMVERKEGLIVNISSAGGLRYLFNVAYGIGKSACDRMMADCGVELRRHNVACISLWPGPVITETVADQLEAAKGDKKGAKVSKAWEHSETSEFSGLAIGHLALDKHLMKKSGTIQLAADLSDEYGFKDINGEHPMSLRCISYLLRMAGFATLSQFIPRLFKIPKWMLAIQASRF